MIRIKYSIKDTNYGIILTNINDESNKVVINHTGDTATAPKSKVKHYAKQVEPSIAFMSGLFFDAKKNKYNGKLPDGTKFNIWINGNYADLETY